MPHDEGLAQRIREQLEGEPRILEKRMFGGVAFLASGHMAAGVIRDELMVRVGPDAYAEALARPHARAMDFTGRPMRGFVQVAPAGFEDDADLRAWLERGIAYAEMQEETHGRPSKAAARRRREGAAAKPEQRTASSRKRRRNPRRK